MKNKYAFNIKLRKFSKEHRALAVAHVQVSTLTKAVVRLKHAVNVLAIGQDQLAEHIENGTRP